MVIPLAAIRELLVYHNDRRERLYEFAAGLSPDEYHRNTGVGCTSIHGILLHCLQSEAYWVLKGLQKAPVPVYDSRSYPALSSLRSLAAEVRGQTDACLAGLTEDAMAREESVTYSSGNAARFTVSEALLHIIEHDIYHRGQVLALAAQMGHEPPDLDLI